MKRSSLSPHGIRAGQSLCAVCGFTVKRLFLFFISRLGVTAILCWSFSSQGIPRTDCENSLKNDSAPAVFINFAKEHLGDKWKREMNLKMLKNHGKSSRNWRREIIRKVRGWPVEEARRFLKILTERLGVEGALNRLARFLSYFPFTDPYTHPQTNPLSSFFERLSYYDSYMGEERTTAQLGRSLGGFASAGVEETRKLSSFLESHYGSKDIVVWIMGRDLYEYSKTRRSQVEPVLRLLDMCMGRRAVIDMSLGLRDDLPHTVKKLYPRVTGGGEINLSQIGSGGRLRYLSLRKLKILQKILDPFIVKLLSREYTSISLSERESAQRAVRSFVSLSADNLFIIQKEIELFEEYVGQEATAQIFIKSPQVFAQVKGRLHSKAKLLEARLGRERTARFMERNYLTFITGDLLSLEAALSDEKRHIEYSFSHLH